MKKVRLKDIAKLAQVSETTVSLVLNDKAKSISQEKINEIKTIASQLNYRPNYLAKSLSTNKTYTIGLIVPDIENLFFASLVKNLIDILNKEGYLCLVSISNESMKQDIKLIGELENRNVDGLLLALSNESLQNEAFIKNQLEQLTIPYVLVDRIFHNDEKNQVHFDNRYGGYIATQHLIDQGHEKIACITGNIDSFNARERYLGYKDALKDNGIALDPNLVKFGEFTFNSGYNQALDLFDLGIDSVFCSNDLIAYGFVSAMMEKNIACQDIDVVGYDNLEILKKLYPLLKSVSQDIDHLSNESATMLLSLIENDSKANEIILKPQLVVI